MAGTDRGWFDRETWRLAPAGGATVVTNPGHAGVLADRLGIDAVTISLAPNVPDLGGGPGRAQVHRRLGVPVDAEVIGFFGFVHPVKGVRYLIEALATLRAAGRDRLHLLVLGGFASLALPAAEAAAFRAELTGLAHGHGVAEHVTWTGHRRAAVISAALNACDLAVFPFTAGATTKSGALLSAFAHRLPTVVTVADPPDPELVDGRTVVVAPRVRSSAALVAAIGRLLDDPRCAPRVAAGGAAISAERTWPRIADAHRALYRDVLSAGPVPGTTTVSVRLRDILVVDLLGGLGDLVMVLPVVHAWPQAAPGRTAAPAHPRPGRCAGPHRSRGHRGPPRRAGGRTGRRAGRAGPAPPAGPGGQHHPAQRYPRRDRRPRPVRCDRPVAAPAAGPAGDQPIPADPDR